MRRHCWSRERPVKKDCENIIIAVLRGNSGREDRKSVVWQCNAMKIHILVRTSYIFIRSLIIGRWFSKSCPWLTTSEDCFSICSVSTTKPRMDGRMAGWEGEETCSFVDADCPGGSILFSLSMWTTWEIRYHSIISKFSCISYFCNNIHWPNSLTFGPDSGIHAHTTT